LRPGTCVRKTVKDQRPLETKSARVFGIGTMVSWIDSRER
jgi:hypothetical protein